ncbi:MAG TPA: transposase [Cyanothece sp. UBA12306]|nr:transposase [Cyanothece sp. UBA12306]
MECQWLDNTATDLPQLSETLTESSVHFRTHFVGYMEMYSDIETVTEYLNAHQGWFSRCATPMKTQPLGDRGYILTVGKFGSFGYEVEPKIAVVLHPSQRGLFLMNTIPIPGETNLGYEVDYQASMQLTEIPLKLAQNGLEKAYKKQGLSQLPDVITKVEWRLEMEVAVQFPKFIYKLPLGMIEKTGDRVLSQIVRQISPRLTHKVQQDFHSRYDLPLPPKSSRHLERVVESQGQIVQLC